MTNSRYIPLTLQALEHSVASADRDAAYRNEQKLVFWGTDGLAMTAYTLPRKRLTAHISQGYVRPRRRDQAAFSDHPSMEVARVTGLASLWDQRRGSPARHTRPGTWVLYVKQRSCQQLQDTKCHRHAWLIRPGKHNVEWKLEGTQNILGKVVCKPKDGG